MRKKAKMGMGQRAAVKKARLKPWILANNPDDNNKCQCFKDKVPTKKWVAINSFTAQPDCSKFLSDCSAFFMKMPLTPAKKKMALGRRGVQRRMGMMR